MATFPSSARAEIPWSARIRRALPSGAAVGVAGARTVLRRHDRPVPGRRRRIGAPSGHAGRGSVSRGVLSAGAVGGPAGAAAFSRGELFTPTITRALRRVGIMLAAGALMSVFIVPSLTRALGFGPGYVIAYDVGGLVLGAVGLALTLLANVLSHAFALQSELDEIF
ncbi:DUF2975 domain-containing protein [Polyangium sp. y55x31]|uniref:DUF2975 domain-containing protein n=1 Tax=Polyangium sp. y55x31 TaxID=3042688 RepID=UPI002482D6BE|nr:DUF2975 domain-containing protein [Polyangium sp. y55x31]MDI1480092.1 DUF2975 domain-containing protein [Polyangium sp. y55x31]